MALNILVVDDSSVMRKMIIRTIKMCGLEIADIFEAENGKDGLEQLDQNWIDLLFIDVNMPVMDGLQMLEAVRSKPDTRDLPVLIVSTESNEKRIKIINERQAGFVHKPFTPETLRAKIIETTGMVVGENIEP
ncbi:response regulator [Rhodohalobacter sp. SW132]|uniref:response regulator n=1 Tax=Rhodohalobacter sp. SW132 TaxID=2293433 RepID=UPI000E270E8C|nr:response regulator [Rhodohalobacter sp. SW132]REL38699.1 response regulator [Rhodohalobacter sp. SW132]